MAQNQLYDLPHVESHTTLPWTIYPNVWRVIGMSVIALLFVAAGLFLIIAPPLRPTVLRETFQPIVGVTGLAFGLLGLIVPFYMYVIRRKPIITLNDNGLLWPDGTLVQWPEIKAIELYTIAGNHNLTISLTEASPYFSIRPFIELGFAAASKKDYDRATQIIQAKIN